MHLIPKLRIGLPLFDYIGAEGDLIGFAAQIQLGAVGGGFLVVFPYELLYGDYVAVPVILVHDKHALIFRLKGIEKIRAAVQQGIVACAELIALLGKEVGLRGEPGVKGYHLDEIGQRRNKGVFNGVIVKRLYADGAEIGGNAVVVVLCAGNVVIQGVGHLGGVGGIEHIFGRGNKVARLDLGVFFAFIGVPHYALAKVEGIYGAVIGNIPAFGKAGLHNSVAVEFHKAVYAQRAEHGNVGCGALQIVQRAYLRGIHLSIGSVYLFGVLRGGVGFGIGLRGVVIPLRGGDGAVWVGFGGALAAKHGKNHNDCKQ